MNSTPYLNVYLIYGQSLYNECIYGNTHACNKCRVCMSPCCTQIYATANWFASNSHSFLIELSLFISVNVYRIYNLHLSGNVITCFTENDIILINMYLSMASWGFTAVGATLGVCRLLITVASTIAEHALGAPPQGSSGCGRWASAVMAHGFQQ